MAGQELRPDTLVHERYRIVRAVGRGGMGAVYEAVDLRLGHHVALKQTLVAGEAAERAFEREARLLAALRHPSLSAVSDFFADEGGRFLVMQFIPGKTLAELADERRGPFPINQVLEWADELLGALEYLHGRQPPILHRDIKPANLKVTSQGQVVLLDFGLAKGSGETTSTGPSVYGLTPQYAPLEQFQGSGTEPVSDVFALGGTLYFLLVHAPPVDALTRASAIGMGKPDPLQSPRQLNAEVPPHASAWVTRALAVHKEDRHPSASAMRRELREIRTGITAKEPPTLPFDGVPGTSAPTVSTASTSPGRPRGRRRSGAWLVGGAAAALLLVMIGLTVVRGFGRAGAVAGAAGAEIKLVEGQGFELQWPGQDLWTLYRGSEKLEVHSGSSSGGVGPGRYRIVPDDAVFEPVEFAVEKGTKTLIRPAAGQFELQWAGPDLWTLFRGDKQIAVHSGTRGRVLSPGAYRIVPSDPVFDPIEFSLADGENKLLKPPAGQFELQWAGPDLWTLFRGDKQIAVHSGTRSRVLSPGAYRIVPSQPVFKPIDFKVVEGQKVILRPR